jgi:small-conductance mechanosensitive channel
MSFPDAPAWVTTLPPWVWLLGAFAVACIAGVIATTVVSFIANRLERFGQTTSLRLGLRRTRRASGFVVGVLVFLALMPAAGLTPLSEARIARLGLIAIVAALGVAAYRLCDLAFAIYARRHGGSAEDVQVRRRQTRFNLLRRLSLVTVALTAVAIVFMTVPTLHAVGVSLFASAGVAGLAIGLAARPAISNVLAGIQIAFTEPIRIGDQVVLEGEWGTIEDITTTYVVVRIWDLRRLVLPISYFLEQPFQNWTRENPQLLGTSMFYVDYSMPVDVMREKLHAILKEAKDWDGQVWALQVTDLREHTMEIRTLMSARNAGTAFSLRCEVREKMIAFLREEYPHALPRTRMELGSADLAGNGDADGEEGSASFARRKLQRAQ